MEVKVALKNPPNGANRWGLTLYDSTGVKSQAVTITDIEGEASFDIPDDWAWPLRFWISIIYYPDGSVTVLHQAQSLSPDWPNYVEEFINSPGSYHYNVETGQFEMPAGMAVALGLAITAVSVATVGILVVLGMSVRGSKR